MNTAKQWGTGAVAAVVLAIVMGQTVGTGAQAPSRPAPLPNLAASPAGRVPVPVPAAAAPGQAKPIHVGTVTTGTWTALTNQPPVSVNNCLLLTDGKVFCQQYGSRTWYKLTPDASGSYAAGTWAAAASTQSGYAPLYFASAVLPDGRVIIQGGEYECSSGCTSVWQTQGSIYNPATNAWTAVAPPSGWTTIGDASSMVLADGRFLLSDCCSGNSAVLNPTTLTYSSFGSGKNASYNDEESWALLPDGSVLTVDMWPAGNYGSEKMNTSTGAWSSAGTVPVSLGDNVSGHSYETGAGLLRPDGTVFFIGANPNISSPTCCTGYAHTAVYNAGTWSAGPDIPNHDGANDAPAAVLPSGNVLIHATIPAVGNVFGTTSRFYEYDGTSISAVNLPTNCTTTCPFPSYVGGMLVLPTGQVLFSTQSGHVELYTPAGSPSGSWAPTITTIPASLHAGRNAFVEGTQLNGMTQGAYYGDDQQSATNFPIVRITNTGTGHQFFAKSHAFSSSGVQTGAATTVSASFDLPAGIELGASTVVSIANGIASAAKSVNIIHTGALDSGDFDNDSKTDVSIFRAGAWYSSLSGGSATALGFGTTGDKDVAADFDGDGKVDQAVFRNGAWYIFQSSTSTVSALGFGTTGDIPLAADVDGDGKADEAVFRPSTGAWYINKSGGGVTAVGFGTSGDQPLLADYDGDGKADITIFRPSTGAWYIQLSGGGSAAFLFGASGDVPVTGDWDGDGKADPAVFRNGTWFVAPTHGSNFNLTWGTTGDIPVSGDFDGDGRSDFAVFRNGAWYIRYANGSSTALGFGTTGDKPVGRLPGS